MAAKLLTSANRPRLNGTLVEACGPDDACTNWRTIDAPSVRVSVDAAVLLRYI